MWLAPRDGARCHEPSRGAGGTNLGSRSRGRATTLQRRLPMRNTRIFARPVLLTALLAASISILAGNPGRAGAQAPEPRMTVPNLRVQARLTGFVTPIG